jgi:hypothetical protein
MSDAMRARSSNPILVKDDIGRAKRTCYDLPHESHAFGRCEQPDLEGAREVTMSWAAHVPRPPPVSDSQDFIKLNKMASRAKMGNAKQAADFRRNVDVRLASGGASGPLPKVIPSDVIPSFAYGRKSRPSTPISAVLGGHYAAEHEDHLMSTYDRYAQEGPAEGSKTKVKLTKKTKALISDARIRNNQSNPQEQKELFKMSKFKKVPSRLALKPLVQSSSMPNLGYASPAEVSAMAADASA